MIPLKIDLHVHTTHSGDSLTTVAEAIEWAKRRNLDGIAITDHNSVDALREIAQAESDLIVLLGEEIDTKEGHLIALGIDEGIPSNLPYSETTQIIRQAGGLAVVPHPFDFFRSGLGPRVVRSFVPDALEVANSHSLFFNLTRDRGFRLAQELNVSCVGGSDSHTPETIGDSYTVVSCGKRCQNSILKSIKEGRTQVCGAPTALWYRLKTLPLVLNKV
ncbi:PHP domain-containing protein [Candidatus Bathyarchaeota archaeon]|nr:PHP domain-containing protein [Candidatus Bathyarchaeota archaeon]